MTIIKNKFICYGVIILILALIALLLYFVIKPKGKN